MTEILCCRKCGEFFTIPRIRGSIDICPECREKTRVTCKYVSEKLAAEEPEIVVHWSRPD